MSEHLSRRHVLLATPAAVSFAIAVPTVANDNLSPDAELLALGVRLNDAWTRQRQAEHLRGPEAGALLEAAFGDAKGIVGQTERRGVFTWDGLKVKARAVLWCHDGEPRIELTEHQTTDVRIAQAILYDLLG
jgi:hypothetical protein